MKKCLFMTVGTGENIEKGMMVSIRSNNPDHIVFLASKEAIEKKKGFFDKNIQISSEWKEIQSHEDLGGCIKEFDEIVKEYQKTDCILAFDITFGTKPMTAALAMIAQQKGNFISYVSGAQRDQHGKVISGTERCIIHETVNYRARMSITEAIKFFNNGLYRAAREVLLKYRDVLDERLEERRYIETILILINFQLAREDFHFDRAGESLKEIYSRYKVEFASLLNLNPESLSNKFEDIIKQLSALHENPFATGRLGELIASAKRAARIGRFNDAIARLYRALEFAGQLKLKEFNMIDDDLLPLCRVVEGRCERVDDYKQRPSGVAEIYRCLSALGVEGASRIMGPGDNQPNELLSRRNRSILAHGFRALSEDDYKAMLEMVSTVARDFGYDIKPVVSDLSLKQPF